MNNLSPRHPRRTRPEWKQIMLEFERSDISATQFCEERDVSYQSFLKWRSTFNAESRNSDNDFIEITPQVSTPVSEKSQTNWKLELELPGGCILRMR